MYTMEDIGNFIEHYKSALPKRLPILANFSSKVHERYSLELWKRKVFEREYLKYTIATPEEQEKFILEMTPVLDSFYKENPNFKADGIKR